MQDHFARFGAAVSIVVSIAAVYYTRSQTPYFYAQPHQMSYWTIESNSLTDDKRPKDGQLTVHVYNDSDTPARDVLVVVRPLSKKPTIECNETCVVQDGINGAVLVKIARIPSKSTVLVEVTDDVTEYRRAHNIGGGPDFQYCPYVLDVQTEFGAIHKHYESCKEYLSPLPNDVGAKESSDAKKKLTH